jgi:hypothetical protein
MTHMRSLGPRSLDVECRQCHHRAIVNVDTYRGDTPVPSFGLWMRRSKCGQKSASSVRPDWTQLKNAPRGP